MGTDLLKWRPFTPPSALPEGATVTVVTKDGTIIARSADANKWIGRDVWDEHIMKQALAATEGVLRATGADGVDRVFGVRAVAGLPWLVLAGLPEESVFAPARERLLETGTILALVVAVVIVLAWGLVARLSNPIRAIAEAVGARAEGVGQTRIPVAGPIEVAHVARELNRMIESGERAAAEVAKQAERLRIVHEIDRAIIAEAKPAAIASAVLQPLRLLLGVARANINLIDSSANDVEWFASAGRHRTHIGAGERFPMHLLGDVDALRRGEPQLIDTRAQPPGKERDALLASGVHCYMAVPMITGGELIGALSFGDERDSFPEEQITIAKEVATQLAVAISQARLFETVQRLNESLERRVAERTQQLEISNKELESFSYSVSHDLRAPLRAVDGYALMLVEDYGERLDDEGRRLLKVVRESAVRMGRLIDDLLKFSQLGRRTPALARLDMRALASEVVGEIAPSFPKARVQLGPLPEAIGDRAMLRHVWSNLVGNALKYSHRSEAPRIEISGRIESRCCIYSVRDNGAGFDMRYYDKLFAVFQRLHRDDEFEGTGVGLAIVQRVVSRHGGRVWGEGAVGTGASFHFSLPTED
jgi:signal transduction histidine kinase